MQGDYRRLAIDKMDRQKGNINNDFDAYLSFGVARAEKSGAQYAEVYMLKNRELEVFVENNDLKQSTYHTSSTLGIRVLVDG